MTLTDAARDRFRRAMMSRPAADLFQIATVLAGFDGDELWREIVTAARRPIRLITEPQVCRAMQRICDRDPDYVAARAARS